MWSSNAFTQRLALVGRVADGRLRLPLRGDVAYVSTIFVNCRYCNPS
jgi:hypothetical protein